MKVDIKIILSNIIHADVDNSRQRKCMHCIVVYNVKLSKVTFGVNTDLIIDIIYR